MSDIGLPTPEQIIAIHDEIERAYDLTYTGTCVAAPKLKLRRIVEEAAEQDDLYASAASLLRSLVTAHLFEDGNKRTAWIAMREHLERNGTAPAECGVRAERVLRRIRRYEVDEIATWLSDGHIDRSRLEP